MSTDALSEVLHAVRLSGTVFLTMDARAPWVAEAPAAREVVSYIMPGVEHVIEYHVIARGSCWAGIADQAPVRLGPGDVIVFPRGDPHVLSSSPGMRGVPDREMPHKARQMRLPIRLEVGQGSGEQAQVISGFLGCAARPFNPLLATLPRFIHLPHAPAAAGVIEPFVKLALAESADTRVGSDCVLARLSELLFVDIMRRYLASLPAGQFGWLAGLRDQTVGRALGKLHDRPAHPWTLDTLAREVGASRALLTERFANFLGQPPMRYLAQWRMQLAATLLSTTALTVAEIADQVGYGSETDLSRAYKRWLDVAPADWRGGKRPDPNRRPPPDTESDSFEL